MPRPKFLGSGNSTDKPPSGPFVVLGQLFRNVGEALRVKADKPKAPEAPYKIEPPQEVPENRF